MQVREYMTREVITLSPDMEVLKALMVLAGHDIAGAPVLAENGTVVGVLTEKDCLERALAATYHSEYGGLVSEYMSAPAITLSPDDGMVQAAEQFVSLPFHRFPVTEDGKLVGILSRRDVIQALAGAWQ
jgi:CBS domain-containing protein